MQILLKVVEFTGLFFGVVVLTILGIATYRVVTGTDAWSRRMKLKGKGGPARETVRTKENVVAVLQKENGGKDIISK